MVTEQLLANTCCCNHRQSAIVGVYVILFGIGISNSCLTSQVRIKANHLFYFSLEYRNGFAWFASSITREIKEEAC